MIRTRACGNRQRMECSDLVNQLGEQLREGNGDLFSPEVFVVVEARVSADGDVFSFSCADRREDRQRITGVKTGRDVCRADELEQFAVVARAFSQIGIEINGQVHHDWRLRPMRKRSSSRSRSSRSRCASAGETSENRT